MGHVRVIMCTWTEPPQKHGLGPTLLLGTPTYSTIVKRTQGWSL